MPHLRATEPVGAAPVNGANVKVVADAHDPNRSRVAHCAVASLGGNLQFLCLVNLVELVARPFCHLRPLHPFILKFKLDRSPAELRAYYS